jgi:hypothetical protein
VQQTELGINAARKKFDKWWSGGASKWGMLVQSLVYPVDKIRLESTLFVIHVKVKAKGNKCRSSPKDFVFSALLQILYLK